MSRSRCRSRSAWSHRRTPMSSPFRLAAPCAAPTSSRTAVCCGACRHGHGHRKTAVAVSSESKPRRRGAEHVPPRTPSRRPTSPCPTTGWPTVSVRYRKAHLSRFRPDRPEGVRRELRRRGRRKRADHLPVSQNVGYDATQARRADQVLVPLRRRRRRQGHRQGFAVGLPGNPDEPITMTRLLPAAAHLLGWIRCLAPSSRRSSTATTSTRASRSKPEVTFVDFSVTSQGDGPIAGGQRGADERDGWRCGAASCRSRSPRWDWWRCGGALLGSSACAPSRH